MAFISQISTRDVTSADIPIIKEYYQHSALFPNFNILQFEEAIQLSLITPDNEKTFHYFAVVKDDDIIGVILLNSMIVGKSAYIHAHLFSPSVRGQWFITSLFGEGQLVKKIAERFKLRYLFFTTKMNSRNYFSIVGRYAKKLGYHMEQIHDKESLQPITWSIIKLDELDVFRVCLTPEN